MLAVRSSDSLATRVAIMAARKALQEVYLQRWITWYKLRVISHRARTWLRRRSAMRPFHGGRNVRARPESSPRVLKLRVVKRQTREVKREPRIVD